MKELSNFIGRCNIYAKQLQDGSYIPIHKKITPLQLEKHLKGEETYGTYVIKENGFINYIVIDIDGEINDDMIVWKKVGEMIMELFYDFDRCLEFSGRRGYHVWVFLEQEEPPKFMRELVKTRLKMLGLRNIEIYPKQDSIDELKKQLGNLIKLPKGKHKKGGWSQILKYKKGEL